MRLSCECQFQGLCRWPDVGSSLCRTRILCFTLAVAIHFGLPVPSVSQGVEKEEIEEVIGLLDETVVLFSSRLVEGSLQEMVAARSDLEKLVGLSQDSLSATKRQAEVRIALYRIAAASQTLAASGDSGSPEQRYQLDELHLRVARHLRLTETGTGEGSPGASQGSSPSHPDRFGGLSGLLGVVPWWPLFGFVVFMYLIYSRRAPRRLGSLLRPFTKLKFLGTEFVLSKEGSREFSVTVEDSIEEASDAIKREYSRKLIHHRVRQQFEGAIELLKVKNYDWQNHNWEKFRFTIHVPDILFSDTLYQLLDYYPRGRGRNRRWSTRSGILGRAWRSSQSICVHKTNSNPEVLIDEYGMTREEAWETGEGREAFLCVLLYREEDRTPLGIFYADSKERDVLPSEKKEKEELLRDVEEACKSRGLTASLKSIRKEFNDMSLMVRIHDDY